MAGAVWGAVVFAMMWYVVVPAVDPGMLNLNAPAFFVGHLIWGAALGLLWAGFGASDQRSQLWAA